MVPTVIDAPILNMKLRRRSLIWISAGLALLITLVCAKPVLIAYHRYQMERCNKAFWDGADDVSGPHRLLREIVPDTGLESHELYEHHRAWLVSLGDLTLIEYTFQHIKLSTPEWRHLWRRIDDEDCPTYDQNGGVIGRYSTSPEPAHLQIWCQPKYRDQWRNFLRTVDVPDFRQRFIDNENPSFESAPEQ